MGKAATLGLSLATRGSCAASCAKARQEDPGQASPTELSGLQGVSGVHAFKPLLQSTRYISATPLATSLSANTRQRGKATLRPHVEARNFSLGS